MLLGPVMADCPQPRSYPITVAFPSHLCFTVFVRCMPTAVAHGITAHGVARIFC